MVLALVYIDALGMQFGRKMGCPNGCEGGHLYFDKVAPRFRVCPIESRGGRVL